MNNFYRAGQVAALEKLAGAARIKRVGDAVQRMFGHLHPADVPAAIRTQNSGAGWENMAEMADLAHVLSLNAAPGSSPHQPGRKSAPRLARPGMSPSEVARAQGLARQRDNVPGIIDKATFNKNLGFIRSTPYLSPEYRKYDSWARRDLDRPRFELDPKSSESPDVQRGRFLRQHPLRAFAVPDASKPSQIAEPLPAEGVVLHGQRNRVNTQPWDPTKPNRLDAKRLSRERQVVVKGERLPGLRLRGK